MKGTSNVDGGPLPPSSPVAQTDKLKVFKRESEGKPAFSFFTFSKASSAFYNSSSSGSLAYAVSAWRNDEGGAFDEGLVISPEEAKPQALNVRPC